VIRPATFSARTTNGFLIGEVHGEVDVATAPGLERELASAIPSTAHGLLIDLSPVPYIDSAGIRLLFSLADLLQARRQQLRLVVPPEAPIRTVLSLVGIDAVAPISPSIDEALVLANAAVEPSI
jgi:anti-anti-sigma factor